MAEEQTLQYKNPIVFFNPKSAGGKTGKRQTEIKNLLNRAAFRFDSVTFAETAGNAADNNAVVRQALQEQKHDLIITVGGDGTISQIINGMYILPHELHRPVMPLPCGTGNSVLRDFHIHNMEDVARRYQTLSQPRDFDLLLCESADGQRCYCINLVGMGFISDVVTEVLKFHKKWGAFSYVAGVLSALKTFRRYHVTLTLGSGDNKQTLHSDAGQFITLSNTKYSGGGIMIAPNASYNDGLIDVVLLHDLTKAAFLRGFVKTMKGHHVGLKGCEYIQTDKVTVTADPPMLLMPDGELAGQTPLTVSVIKNAVKIVV